MSVETRSRFNPRHVGIAAATALMLAIAGLAARTPLAAAYPLLALLLFLWIASDTMLLSLMARSPGRRPAPQAVLGALAAASLVVWLGSPPALRQTLLAIPALAATLLVIVLAHGCWAAARARRAFRIAGPARRDRWSAAAGEILPAPFVRLLAAELSLIHMALFRWGGPADIPADSRAFSYHRHLAPICATLLCLQLIEIAVYHILVGHWSRTAALVMFVLSDLGLIYLVGLIKSFRFRPVLVTPEGVHVRAGFLIDRLIPMESIAGIETAFPGDDVRRPATLNAALLAWPNILLRLDEPLPRPALLRRRPPFRAVAFRLDDPEPFVRLLQWRLAQRGREG